jgi:hypothetical protein
MPARRLKKGERRLKKKSSTASVYVKSEDPSVFKQK